MVVVWHYGKEDEGEWEGAGQSITSRQRESANKLRKGGGYYDPCPGAAVEGEGGRGDGGVSSVVEGSIGRIG